MSILILVTMLNIFASDLKTLELSGRVQLKVEVADSEAERAKGLMHRTELANDQGMLFVFKQSQILSFWMRNTYIPLSIGYFDQDKVLKEVHQMTAQNLMERNQNLKSYVSRCMCMYALEVNQGWFKKNKVKIGSKFKLVK